MNGRVAVVTGAGGGIGREIALGLARRGVQVACADVRREGAALDRPTFERVVAGARAFHDLG